MMQLKNVALCLVAFLSLIIANAVSAHAFDPSLLMVKNVGDKEWEFFWRRPDLNGTPLPLSIETPSSCLSKKEVTTGLVDAVWVSKWQMICEPLSFSEPVVINGLESVEANVVVRYWPGTGDVFYTYLVKPDNPSIRLESDSSFDSVFVTYAYLGFEHILEGWDHLLFLFALILLVQCQRQLIIAITAFTLAHSITLFASTMNVVNLNPQLVEALIAFSIVFLAYEVAINKPGKSSLTTEYPWVVTFTFGLLHGFGFAGALREIGLPQNEIPMTLLAFNVGVEVGQIFFLIGAFLITTLVVRWFKKTIKVGFLFTKSCAYFIGTASSYWLFERVLL